MLIIVYCLNIIMDYDKVLVIDKGWVVEFDKFEVLFENDMGYYI